MLCFDKLTCEHNNKNHLKFFVLWEYIFNSDSLVEKIAFIGTVARFSTNESP